MAYGQCVMPVEILIRPAHRNPRSCRVLVTGPGQILEAFSPLIPEAPSVLIGRWGRQPGVSLQRR